VIDFRYHIVSLISVFIALAVGIALGAGPLKEAIGDTLTGQVQQLRQDRDGLRTDLTTAVGAQADQRAYLEAVAPQLLSGALTGRRVAVVTLGPANADVVAGIEAQLQAAGATVSGQVAVTDRWTDPGQRSFRQALVGNVVQYLAPKPAVDAGTEVELAEALAQGLTGANPAARDRLSEPAGLLLELLAGSDSKLITVKNPITAPADTIIVLTAPTGKKTTATPAPAAEVLAAQVAVASAAQARSEGAVVAAVGTMTAGDLVSTVMAKDALAARLTTVTGVDDATGQISVPLALNARIGGTTGHFGFGDKQSPFPQRAVLPAVDRTPVLSAPAAAGAGAAG
jgi:hypothetical protein